VLIAIVKDCIKPATGNKLERNRILIWGKRWLVKRWKFWSIKNVFFLILYKLLRLWKFSISSAILWSNLFTFSYEWNSANLYETEIIEKRKWIIQNKLYNNNLRIDYWHLLLRNISTLTYENKALVLYSLDTLSYIRLKALVLPFWLRHSVYPNPSFLCLAFLVLL
jgi:hypothetical protein